MPTVDNCFDDYKGMAYVNGKYCENLMRKLYSKFTLIQLDPAWIDSIPDEVRNSRKEVSNGDNPLYDLDFITLNDVLFKETPLEDVTPDVLKSIKSGDIDKEDLGKYIPESNWERYFSELVECESKYLQTRWDKLYKLRNKIAHNKLFTKSDLENVKKITEEVKEKVDSALDNISTLDVESLPVPPALPEDKLAIEGELVSEDKLPVKTENTEEGSLGALATVALIVGFLAAVSKAK
ncbi:hypothetical protein DI392_17900 [Vibrio albus]|uniref:Uncharacterized protein n=1 Tax=Vibrio albus TaxID=2200953 RepID=A0A2U3B5K7_9VIBR|nr:HEPN domain-containing protein [Vibrio albus]PWI32052.1 hypothetical protein DI392_17900 [Vibrio albus]